MQIPSRVDRTRWISYEFVVLFLSWDVYQIEGLGFNLGILTQFIHQL